MFIYEIRNTVNHKCYIGQTTRNLYIRWAEHKCTLKKQRHGNPYLQNAWNKYGEDVFEIHVIATATSIEELNTMEKTLIAERKPEYNLRSGGNLYKHSLETKKKISASKSGIPNGQRGIKRSPLSEIHRVKLSKAGRSRDYPNVVSPDGSVYTIDNLRQFARNHGMTQPGLRSLINGRISFYKGWKLEKSPFTSFDRNLNISKSLRPNGFPNVISPDGSIYFIEHLTNFCKTHGLSVSNMSMLINGKKLVYKGWMCAPTENSK